MEIEMGGIWHTVNISPDITADVRVTKRDGRYWVTAVNATGSALTAGAIYRLPLARIEAMANAGADVGDFMADTKRPKLERPDRTDPDGFYQQIADAYRDVIRSILTDHRCGNQLQP